MKYVMLIVMLVVISGCGVVRDIPETVDDCRAEAVQVWTQNAYDIIFGVPENVIKTFEQGDCAYYVSEDEGFEIFAVKLLSCSIDSSVKFLSGFELPQTDPVKTTRFSLPEYQYCWCAQTDGGLRVYYADLVIDDIYTYGIICSAPEDAWKQYSSQTEKEFSSFGLFFNEGI